MRAVLKKLTPSPAALQGRWFLKPFSRWLGDPRLWCVQRRSVTGAFSAGLAICFIPLPVHMLVAGVVAVWLRVNVPVIYATVWLVNPVTAVPVYFTAYRVGVLLLRRSPDDFAFHPSWDWLASGLGPMWKPFLIGCLACAIGASTLGRVGLELLWRWRVLARYRSRHAGS